MAECETTQSIAKGAFGTTSTSLLPEKSVQVKKDFEIRPSGEDADREVALHSQLDHPNIVKYYDSFTDDASVHISVEKCEGGTLHSHIYSKSAPTEKEIWTYFVQVCRAVDHMHSKDLLHRDLRLENIFLTKEGVVKLGKLQRAVSFDKSEDKDSHQYLPPEISDKTGYVYDTSCDMWGLGCILYEMAARKPPFSEVHMKQHLETGKPRLPAKPLAGSLSTDLRQLVKGLLELEPNNRLTMAQLLQNPSIKDAAKCLDSRIKPEADEPLDDEPATSKGACGISLSEGMLQASFKLHVNDCGQVRGKNGESFDFNGPGGKEANQDRYDFLGQIMELYIQERLDHRLQKIHLCKDRNKGTYIYASDGYETCDKLLILINGSGVVKAGQWSRRLIIEEGLDVGSQLPYIDRALDNGWGVLVMNPNDRQQAEGSRTREEHGLFVWEHFIACNKMKKIAIVAHSAGATITNRILDENPHDFFNRVKAIAFTDARNSGKKTDHMPYVKRVAVDWVVSGEPVGTPLPSKEIEKRSAGTEEHSKTSHTAIDKVFQFLKQKFSDTSLLPEESPSLVREFDSGYSSNSGPTTLNIQPEISVEVELSGPPVNTPTVEGSRGFEKEEEDELSGLPVNTPTVESSGGPERSEEVELSGSPMNTPNVESSGGFETEEEDDDDLPDSWFTPAAPEPDYAPVPSELLKLIESEYQGVKYQGVKYFTVAQAPDNSKHILVTGVEVESIQSSLAAAAAADFSGFKIFTQNSNGPLLATHMARDDSLVVRQITPAQSPNSELLYGKTWIPNHVTSLCDLLVQSEVVNGARGEIGVYAVVACHMMLSPEARNHGALPDNLISDTRRSVEEKTTSRRFLVQPIIGPPHNVSLPPLVHYRSWVLNQTEGHRLCPVNRCTVLAERRQICPHMCLNDIALLNLSLEDAREICNRNNLQQTPLVPIRRMTDLERLVGQVIRVGSMDGQILNFFQPVNMPVRYGLRLTFKLGLEDRLVLGDCGSIVQLLGGDNKCRPVGMFIGEFMSKPDGFSDVPVYEAIILSQALKDIEIDYPHHVRQIKLFASVEPAPQAPPPQGPHPPRPRPPGPLPPGTN